MPTIAHLDIPELVSKRLASLADAKNTTPAAIAAQALEQFTNSPDTRRAIRVHRRGQSLADLGWIDSYDGQSVDEIFAFADSDDAASLLFNLEQAIEQHWRKQPGARTGVENIVMAVMALVREVNNGGFDQFFRNSSKRWTLFVKDALVHIGRKDAAKIAGRAVRAIGLPRAGVAGPEVFEILDKKMITPNSRRDEILQECDVEFFNLTGLHESVLAYARKHPGGILRQS